MATITKEGKEINSTLESILEENNLKEEDVIYTTETKKGKLFKGDTVLVTVIQKDDIYSEIKEYLKQIINGLGLEVNFELKNKDDFVVIKMYADNNSILIGKNGQTLKALEIIIKQMVQVKYGVRFKISLDVENYKDKKESTLIRIAKRTAKEVAKTKIEAKLENMNAYERRIIHNALTDFKGVTTESEGEEPNRHIVIKPSK